VSNIFIIKPNLSKIKNIFINADEIWVATALLKTNTLNSIMRLPKKNCIYHFIIGTYLPTDLEALNILYNKNPLKFHVKIYTSGKFHPKVYIARKGNNYFSIIGSSNCTEGGFLNNTEVNIISNKTNHSIFLKKWFDKENENGKTLNEGFLKKYEEIDKNRKRRNKESEKEQKELNDSIIQNENEIIKLKKTIERKLRIWKRTNDYKETIKDRINAIRKLRNTLDYPYFRKIEYDDFFKIRTLGSILGFNQFRIHRQKDKFKKVLYYLLNSKDVIEEKINNTCYKKSKYYIFGVTQGLITKILNIFEPNKYPVWNNASDKALYHYGMYYYWGQKKGEMYKLMCNTLKELCEKTKIYNLSVLDEFLYDYFDRKRSK